MKFKTLYILCLFATPILGQEQEPAFNYKVEATGIVTNGEFAPLWLTANRYGKTSAKDKQASLQAGIFYHQDFKHHWRIEAGLDLIGGKNLTSNFWVHQAYADFSWNILSISVGSKERNGYPLSKNEELTSGWMVEGNNMRPIPQIRGEIKDYFSIPGTKNWVAFKGHIAYGWFTDGRWQEDFVSKEQLFTKGVRYHSKSLMLRFGNKDKFPVELEWGIITSAQFGGKQMIKNANGSVSIKKDFPNGMKDYIEIFIPKQKSTYENVSGNHCGSWNFALNSYIGDWKVRAYLEHYFEDHSQMFWQYGRWKDGLLGFEVSLPKNRWISNILWEGMATKDQTGPILYDGGIGSFHDLQMSGRDNYYNNGEFLGWQHHGASIGHPFLHGPQYNSDGTNTIKSNRIRSNHLGISGTPSEEWSWRILVSFARHWGTYSVPLDKQQKQFSGLAEISYKPNWSKGWSASVSLGLDRGNHLGNSTGGMISIRKTGGFNL